MTENVVCVHLDLMALLTVSKELEAGNSALKSIEFHKLAGNFGLCMCVRHSTMMRRPSDGT